MFGLGLSIPEVASRRLGAGAWTPPMLGASLVGWWDATDASTLTILSGAVSEWDSKVGGWSAVQGTAALRPAYSVTGWDGTLPAITGDGLSTNGDILTATGPFATTQSIFIVAERGVQDDSPVSAVRPIYTTAKSSGGTLRAFGPQRPTVDAGQTNFYAIGSGTGSSSAAAPDAFGSGDKAVLFGQISTTPLAIVRVNDGTASSSASDGSGALTASAIGIFGEPTVAARRFAGKIGEIIVMNRLVADEDEYLTIYGYLADKWLPTPVIGGPSSYLWFFPTGQ